MNHLLNKQLKMQMISIDKKYYDYPNCEEVKNY